MEEYSMKCSNLNCLNEFHENEGHEMGTPSGYADDYAFCDACAVVAKKHFDIAAKHDGGMVSAPDCGGWDDKPHTCSFSEEELSKAKIAFHSYR
jgi:hypothetical protein